MDQTHTVFTWLIHLIGGEEKEVFMEGTEHTPHHHGNSEDHVTSTSDTPVCDWVIYQHTV